MRISDWSSDVCSSDLDLFGKGNRPAEVAARQAETGKLYKDREKMRSLLRGGLAAARELSDASAVVMGYCFGGAAVLEMARSGQAEGIAGYATFHDRMCVGRGQRVSVREDVSSRRIF